MAGRPPPDPPPRCGGVLAAETGASRTASTSARLTSARFPRVKVAIDEHEALRLDDHDHGDLLPELGQRGDETPTAPLVADSQVGVSQLELMQLQIHELTLPEVAPSQPSRLARGG
jgi:hypothetical protein